MENVYDRKSWNKFPNRSIQAKAIKKDHLQKAALEIHIFYSLYPWLLFLMIHLPPSDVLLLLLMTWQ